MILSFILAVLCVVTIGLGFTIFINTSYKYIKYHSTNTGLLALFFFLIGVGISWQCCRTLIIYLVQYMYEPIDRILSVLRVYAIFLGAFILEELTRNYIVKSDQHSRKIEIIRVITLFLVFLFAIIHTLTFIAIPTVIEGVYEYQADPMFFLFVYIAYFSITIVFYSIVKKALGKISNKKTTRIFNGFIIALVGTFFLELFTANYIYIFGMDTIVQIIILSITCLDAFVLFLLLFIYGDYIEFVSVYSDLKSVYIITNGGKSIWGHDFGFIDEEISPSEQFLILGGFIYAISCGLGTLVNVSEKLEVIKIGKTTIHFGYGRYIFGLLFTTQESRILRIKLQAYIDRLEFQYGTLFANWNGDLSVFKKPYNYFEQLVVEIFK